MIKIQFISTLYNEKIVAQLNELQNVKIFRSQENSCDEYKLCKPIEQTWFVSNCSFESAFKMKIDWKKINGISKLKLRFQDEENFIK